MAEIRSTLRASIVAAVLALSAACVRTTGPAPLTPSSPGHVMTAQEFMALPSRAPDLRSAYGTQSSQYGELRVPAGRGPFPVVVLIHGGCFKAAFATAASFGAMADALEAEGIATWNIEYRRLGESGSGWPGTYLDVGRAVDHIRELAGAHNLDLRRVVAVGHSAGGHLAMWVAARPRLASGSALYREDPLPIRGVVDLAGPPDLGGDYPDLAAHACGGDRVVEALLGGTAEAVPDRYAQVSALQLLPLGLPQVLVWGARDDQNPAAMAQRYTLAATAAGDPVRLVVSPAAGHFEPASPASSLWPAVRSAIRSLLDGKLPRPNGA